MNNILDSLNERQREAVVTKDGPLLLLAGAGSGKTRVIVHKIAYLVEMGVSPFNIIAITFTNKAAREMKERVEKLVRGGSEIWVSTFHSTCVRILRREIDKIGYAQNFTIYDTSDQERVMKDLLKEFNLSDKLYNPKAVLGVIGRQKDELITPDDFAIMSEGDFRATQIAQLYKAYQKKLKSANALDFDDLIVKTTELFTIRPDVLGRYQDRFFYILVDEYQDTNSAQYQLVRLLASKYENLCVVGDDDQSIYGWRGANIENILGFEKDFPNAKVIRLEQNYRSTQNILDAANAVIKHNKSRKGKKLWTENTKGGGILYYRANTDLDEGLYVAETVTRAVKTTGAKYADFAVLYRTNAQSRSIEEVLFKNALPYRIFGGIRFYERKEVKDLLSYLSAIDNPDNDVAVKRVINYPRRSIGETSVDKIQSFATDNGLSFFAACKRAQDAFGRGGRYLNILTFTDVIDGLREKAAKLSVSALIEEIVRETRFADAIRADAESKEEADNRMDNIGELISKAADFEATAETPDLSAFLADVALIADIDAHSANEDAVALMTLHSSKGLEFPHVFITGFEENLFPSYRAVTSDDEKDVEEERRLCYVGITRAMTQLYITNAVSRRRNGRYESNAPSRFLNEIPRENVEGGAQMRKQAFRPHVQTREEAGGYGRFATAPTQGTRPQKIEIAVTTKQKPDFDVGDAVKHTKFGVGTVLEIRAAGADYEITVDFDESNVKKLMAHLARLEKA